MAEVHLNHKQTNHVSPIEVIYKITNLKIEKNLFEIIKNGCCMYLGM
jgi:hypothetical protein